MPSRKIRVATLEIYSWTDSVHKQNVRKQPSVSYFWISIIKLKVDKATCKNRKRYTKATSFSKVHFRSQSLFKRDAFFIMFLFVDHQFWKLGSQSSVTISSCELIRSRNEFRTWLISGEISVCESFIHDFVVSVICRRVLKLGLLFKNVRRNDCRNWVRESPRSCENFGVRDWLRRVSRNSLCKATARRTEIQGRWWWNFRCLRTASTDKIKWVHCHVRVSSRDFNRIKVHNSYFSVKVILKWQHCVKIVWIRLIKK